ncbi:MAG: DUF6080 domain-containing protein [Methylobacter sp.]|nr:DUF6080 domain-containing protein [Methylobacter sp.]
MTFKSISSSVFLGFPVSILVFVLCTISTFYLYELKVFNQEDIILGADPYYRSIAFAQGYGERGLFHPNLSNLVNPFVRGLAWILKPLFVHLPATELRMQIGLFISPFFAAATTYMIYLIAILAKVSFLRALALSLLFGLSISTIGLGSVPDHFLISSFLLSAAVLLVQIDAKLSRRFRFIAWMLLISTVAGITISNMAPLLALFAFSEKMRQVSWQDVVKRTINVFIAAAALTLAQWFFLNLVYGDFSALQPGHAYDKNLGRVSRGLTSHPLRDFLSFPFTIGQSFWGGPPDMEPNPPYPRPDLGKYNVEFQYNAPIHGFSLESFVLLLPITLIGLSIYTGLKCRKQGLLPFIAGAIVFLTFNWLLHTFWAGAEFFLFSPHWHFMSVLALIPLCLVHQARIWTGALLGTSILIAGLNLSVWYHLLKLLPNLELP